MKKNMWKRVAALGISFGMLMASMPVKAFDDVMIVEDDSSIVAEDETEDMIAPESGDVDESDFEESFISEGGETEIGDELTPGIAPEETEKDLLEAASSENSGTCGDNLTWYLDSDGVLTISGTGPMYDYWWNESEELSPFCGRGIKEVEIGEDITSVGAYAFYNCRLLQSVSLPNSIKSIGLGAFSGCSFLENITIPISVQKIESQAFYDCSKLTSFFIPEGVNHVGVLFRGCTALESISVSDNNAYYCSIDGVLYDKEITTLFFCPQKKDSISIPDSVKTINDCAFSGNEKLTSIVFPRNVISISSAVFELCTNLTTVTIPSGVTSLGMTFDGSNVTTICGYTGSYAEQFALENGYTFVAIEEESAPVTEYTGSLKWDNDRTITGVQYKDSYFENSSFNYNHALARISLGLAMTGFNRPKGNYYSKQPVALTDQEKKLSKAGNAVELLENCGFNVSSMRVNSGYLSKPGANTIGDLMAVKDIGDDTKLIAIVIRGGGYESEWAGNFNVYNPGSGSEHVGFEMAFDQVREDFHDYLAENNITGKVKVWITGYSRGAAVANLTAAYLNELSQIIGSIQFSNSDVYAYTFETPQNTKSTHVSDAFHRNIFNIVNPIDLVPKVAFSKWGYSRYGTTYYLPSLETTARYGDLSLEALNYYNALTGKSHISLPRVAGQIDLLDGLLDAVAFISGSDGSDTTRLIAYELQNLMISLNSSSDSTYLSRALSYFVDRVLLNEKYTLNKLIRKFGPKMIEIIIQAHYPELTYAWMQTVNGGMCSVGRYEYRLIKVNCPVNVQVYDSSGSLVASIENDEVQDIGNDTLAAFIDDDGQKMVCIPSDSHYEVVITATDDGTMTYAISDVINGEEVRRTSYFDIPINNEDTFVANTYSSASGENSSGLSSSDGSMLSPDEVQTDSFDQYYSVQVTTNGGGAVSGAGTKKKGDYIRVIATPEAHSQFMGWYIGEKLMSEEMTYRFRVESDTVINGRFLKGNHDFGSWKVTKAATESSTGIQTRTCSSCGYKESKTIPKSQPKITISKKPTIKKPAAAKGKITVKWKHFKHTSKKTKKIWKKIKKVQVQCATDKAFKNIVKDVKIGRGKTKYVIKGLNKKTTYYVRVRYYDGTGYSAWSKVKKVKTK